MMLVNFLRGLGNWEDLGSNFQKKFRAAWKKVPTINLIHLTQFPQIVGITKEWIVAIMCEMLRQLSKKVIDILEQFQ